MIECNNKVLNGMKFIDLFAGIGGFRIALESLGATCVFSSELDEHAKETYKKNYNVVPKGDITTIDNKEIPEHDILCAGFPCQPFSVSGKMQGFNDCRGTLFFEIARIVKDKKPKIVFMENVKNFLNHDEGRTLNVVKKTMEELGYTFYYKLLNSVDYGVPQNRERAYMVCFRNDIDSSNFEFPKPIELTQHLEDLLLPSTNSEIQKLVVNRKDIHMFENNNTNSSNKPIRIGIVNKGCQGERIYSTKAVAITLLAYGGGAFAKTGGYYVDGSPRKLHPIECARLMGFPDTFKLVGSNNQLYKQFGNSVVVDVIQYIAISISTVCHNNIS